MGEYRLPAFQIDSKDISDEEAFHAYHLTPEPPKQEKAREYIRLAQEHREVKYVMFFLHHHEKYFNSMIEQLRSRDDRWCTNARFLDMKLACRETVLHIFAKYKPDSHADFITFIHPYIKDTILRYRMLEENWSVSSLTVYKQLRAMAIFYTSSGDNEKKALAAYMQKYRCTEETARLVLDEMLIMRSRQYADLDSDETEDDLYPAQTDIPEMIWKGMVNDVVDEAFFDDDVTERTRMLLETKNALCMTCGQVRPKETQPTFQELATLIEATGESGAMRAYNSAADQLVRSLVRAGLIRCAFIRQTSVTMEHRKPVAAVYEYQVDDQPEVGEIRLDLVVSASEVTVFPRRDTEETADWSVEDAINKIIFGCVDKLPLPKKQLIPVRKPVKWIRLEAGEG